MRHKWDEEGEYKQYCKRKKCTAYRTLMENKYPKIGEPKYEWKIVDFDKFILKKDHHKIDGLFLYILYYENSII